MWVRFAPATTDTPPEVGYAIGRAVGTAVVRNRLRRRLRAVIAELSPSMAPGAYLVGAAPAASALTFPQLTAAIRASLTAAGALRSSDAG